MQGKLFQRCRHLLYCSVLSPGGNVNTRRMSQPDMGSIFHNMFQYVRRVYATAINFPCILTLILAELAMNRKIQEISEPKQRIMKIFKIPKFLPLAS